MESKFSFSGQIKAIAVTSPHLWKLVKSKVYIDVKNIGLNNIQTIPQIEEVGNLKFFIDLSKKLSGTISSAVPFVSYSLVNTPPKLSKLEK